MESVNSPKIYTLIWVAVFCFIAITYFSAPPVYEYNFIVQCALLYWIQTFLYLKVKHTKNFMNFDLIFIAVYFIIYFYFPLFIYPYSKSISFLFDFNYNSNIISKGTALALLGLNCYMFGSIYNEKHTHTWKIDIGLIPTRPIFFISLFSLIVYIALGGWQMLAANYTNEVVTASGANYFGLFSAISMMSLIICWFINQRVSHSTYFSIWEIPKIQFIYFIFYIILILAAGSRTYPMQFILIFVGLYTLYFKGFSFRKTCILFSVGIVFMFAIGLMRTNYSNIYNTKSIDGLFTDLIIPTSNLYVSIDHVNDVGINYGQSMLGGLLAPVPFLQGFVSKEFNIDAQSMLSAYWFTKETLGSGSRTGVGSNIIADIYLSFGTFGVICFMFFLGYMVSSFQNGAKRNITSVIGYGIMMSYAIYIVRADYFVFLRPFVWSLIFIALSRKFKY